MPCPRLPAPIHRVARRAGASRMDAARADGGMTVAQATGSGPCSRPSAASPPTWTASVGAGPPVSSRPCWQGWSPCPSRRSSSSW
ncbi:hypothetical protein ACFFX0_12400 [Citricoccus parietis]|uniref:Uncharacterized protein n=1 Tax=Citricoccus parietis TaxID=592307 RepID=A0ABV5FZ46_9MICC